jgi:flavin-dependent dehydrogenase
MHIRSGAYIGIAPLPGGLANVCVVRELRGRRAPGAGLQATITDAIVNDPSLGDRFRHARRVSPVTTLGPLGIESSAAGCPGLLLAGDSAGFIDPMTGDGLRFALRGGELAAEAALRELESGSPAYRALGEARSREFSLKWRLNRGLRLLVGTPRAVAVATTVSTFWEAPIRLLVALAGDVGLANRPQVFTALCRNPAEGYWFVAPKAEADAPFHPAAQACAAGAPELSRPRKSVGG